MTAIDSGAALPKQRADFIPAFLPIVLALAVLPFVGSPSTWITLTVAGLSMGMMIFIMASGLTLVFGLMDVLNFGHGAFIAVGAYMAALVLAPLLGWKGSTSRSHGPNAEPFSSEDDVIRFTLSVRLAHMWRHLSDLPP